MNKKQLNRKAIKAWIKALRSGQYLQTQGYMYGTRAGRDSFCCLGVLTNEFCLKNNKNFDDFFKDRYDPDSLDFETEILPERVQQWTGLIDYVKLTEEVELKTRSKTVREVLDDKIYDHKSLTELLAAFNDAGVSFKQIAQFLEDNLDTFELVYQEHAELYGEQG